MNLPFTRVLRLLASRMAQAITNRIGRKAAAAKTSMLPSIQSSSFVRIGATGPARYAAAPVFDTIFVHVRQNLYRGPSDKGYSLFQRHRFPHPGHLTTHSLDQATVSTLI